QHGGGAGSGGDGRARRAREGLALPVASSGGEGHRRDARGPRPRGREVLADVPERAVIEGVGAHARVVAPAAVRVVGRPGGEDPLRYGDRPRGTVLCPSGGTGAGGGG